MEASAGPWRCLNVTWNLRPHHTRKASRRGLGRGRRFRSSLGNGNRTEASARNSVCPEPRFTSSCDRITGAAEPFARKGPREPGGLRAPGRREGREERVQSGLSPEGHGPWGLTGPGPDLPRPRGLRVPGTSWILRTWIMGTRVFCNLFSQENFPASPGWRRHGLLRRWRALLSGKLDGGGTRAS